MNKGLDADLIIVSPCGRSSAGVGCRIGEACRLVGRRNMGRFPNGLSAIECMTQSDLGRS
jgi:hypothetical protein